jgi:acyl-CoA ligase (AMP-forming) (exosortase A-associated)
MTYLLHHLVQASACRAPDAIALRLGDATLDYGALASRIEQFAAGVAARAVRRGERIAIWLEKRFETVIACFGASAAGCVFVPINPLLKPVQVAHILRDCRVAMLVLSRERHEVLGGVLASCPALRHVVTVGEAPEHERADSPALAWNALLDTAPAPAPPVIDTDLLAILYTSGSTGRPKGVMLSHRNMVAGAKSVASYLGNHAGDVLLAALPLSFDAGFSQLTTAFHVGAQCTLLNYLLPRDVVTSVVRDRVTGITAVPPLWIQLAQAQWPPSVTHHLRYIANTGGRMPRATLDTLRRALPHTRVFLMYGLTEAFRSTYLPPEEVDRRPDSIGKAIPNAEILVLRPDGTPCAPDEPGELVHRGALVGLGYWNDPEKTAVRYKPLPGREAGCVLPEIAVFSGDTVRMDRDGFLYFVGRRDEMIKTSGYRVSPTEVEESLYESGLVAECAAFGVPDDALGAVIAVVVTPLPGRSVDSGAIIAACRQRLPAYMVPSAVHAREGPLPRNANGKIDRKLLAAEFTGALANPVS